METDSPGLGGIAADETTRLIASNKIEGTPVYNRRREHLGTLNHLMIDLVTSQIAYAVIPFGALLGPASVTIPAVEDGGL